MNKQLYPLAISGIFAFAVCLYAPLVTYWYGVNEFAFQAEALFIIMLTPFALLWAGCFVAISALSYFLPQREAEFFRACKVLVSPAHIFVAALVFALCLEGTLLSKGLPAVTGAGGLFESRPRLVIDSLVWLSILGGCLLAWKRLASAPVLLLLALTLLLASGMGDAYLSKEPKIPVTIGRQEVLERMAFHEKDNTFVVVIDALSTRAVEHAFDNDPALADAFDGFIVFKNNLAPGGQTTWAIPAILEGAPYSGGDYQDFMDRALNSPNSLRQSFFQTGYNVYFSSIMPRTCGVWENDKQLESAINVTLTRELVAQLAFRFVPYCAKKHLEPSVIAFLAGIDRKLHNIQGIGNDPEFYGKWLPAAIANKSPNPTLHFHHIWGVHKPYSYNADGAPLQEEDRYTDKGLFTSTGWHLKSLQNIFQLMKDTHIYENSTIILMADHGDNSNVKVGNAISFQLALFMVKPPHSKGKLHYSEAPFSSTYLPRLAVLLRDEPQNLSSYLNSLPNTRFWGSPPDTMSTVVGVGPEELLFTPMKLDDTQKPVTLRPGVQYTTIRPNAGLPLAVPSFTRHVALSGGGGWEFIVPNTLSEIKFPLRSNKDAVKLTISMGQHESTVHGEKIPMHLLIKNMNDGKELYKTTEFLGGKLELDDVSLSSDHEVHLGLTWIQPEKPGKYYVHMSSVYFE